MKGRHQNQRSARSNNSASGLFSRNYGDDKPVPAVKVCGSRRSQRVSLSPPPRVPSLFSLMSLFIGIDSGTQSTKAVVLDLDTKTIVAEARAPHALIAGLPAGHMEQHPQDWAAALDTVILEVAAKIDRSRVRGIGISGQQHGF